MLMLATLILSPLSPAYSKEASFSAPSKINQILPQAKQFNGTVLLVSHGKVVFQASQGVSDASGSKKLTLNSAFNLASVSKPFTALAIAQLVAAGKLR